MQSIGSKTKAKQFAGLCHNRPRKFGTVLDPKLKGLKTFGHTLASFRNEPNRKIKLTTLNSRARVGLDITTKQKQKSKPSCRILAELARLDTDIKGTMISTAQVKQPARRLLGRRLDVTISRGTVAPIILRGAMDAARIKFRSNDIPKATL